MPLSPSAPHADNHDDIPSLSFLQAGCPSWRPTNSVKALKENPQWIDGIWRNWARWCISALWTLPANKIWEFLKSKMVVAAIVKKRKINNSTTDWRILTKFCTVMQLVLLLERLPFYYVKTVPTYILQVLIVFTGPHTLHGTSELHMHAR